MKTRFKRSIHWGLLFSFVLSLAGHALAQSSPPPTGLVGWWRAEGNGNDSSGGGHNGRLLNGGGYDTGKVGQAFSFAGNANTLFVPDSNDFNLTNSLSIGAWIYPKADSWHVLERAQSGSVPYAFGLDAAGHFWFVINSQSGQAELRVPIAYNQWKQVTATLDGATGEMRLYFDGILVTNQTTSVRPRFFTSSSNPALGIGNTPYGGGFPFIGLVDEVLLYSRALSPSEIQTLAQPPAIASFIRTQPTNQTVTVGGTATFIVDADGSTPLSYQWRFNGANIPAATASSLSITNAQVSDAGAYAVLVTNSLGSTASSNATLTVNFPPATVRVVGATNLGGAIITLPVLLTANGNETGVGFSLNYDAARLAYASVAAGSGARNATLIVNSSQSTNGRLGIIVTLPANTTFTAGTQELVQVTFSSAPQTNSVSIPVRFGSSPVVRQLSDVNGNSLPVSFIDSTVLLTAGELEADVSPRPNGDRAVTVTDFVLLGRFAARLDVPANGSEFQRADCAPRGNRGNGVINVRDWVQAGRYAAGLDSPVAAGGPTAPNGPLNLASSQSSLTGTTRKLRVASTTLAPCEAGSVSVNLVSLGDENALGFSVSFDPAQFTWLGASLGSNAAGAALNLNTAEIGSGRLAAVLALPTGANFAAGDNEVLRLSLQPAASLSGVYTVALADEPVLRELADAQSDMLDAAYANGAIAVNAPLTLRISQTGGDVVLAWPEWAAGSVLQESSGLSGWADVTNSPVVVDGERVIAVPLMSSPRFYRLKGQ